MSETKIDKKIAEERELLADLRRKREARGARVDELEAAVDRAEALVKRKRERLRSLSDDELFTSDVDQPARDLRRDALADDVEAAEAELNALLEDLDQAVARQRQTSDRIERHAERVERLRKRRKKIERKEDQLSKFWVLAEFHCNDGTPVPKAAIPALERQCKRVFDPMREKHGMGRCNSGYRHAAYDASVGGVGGYHVYDTHTDAPAADLTFAQGGPQAWAETARQAMGSNGGIGIYPGQHFIHVDPRNYRSDWWG